MKRKILIVFILVLTALGTFHCNTILYGLEQGYYQVKIVYQAQAIEKLLQDRNFPDSLKQKLQLIQEIRRFAVDSLGINDTQNYQTVYDQKGKSILWVVTACPPFELRAYQWNFPIAGKFPYKGFFKQEKAEKEAEKLRKEGYDTEIGEVEGWSTLGILRDPILSNMLLYSEGRLARLIIHELTHATLYVKSNADYNENLATFVGEKGAEQFLIYKFGKESSQYLKYVQQSYNSELFNNHVLRGAKQLDSLYKTFSKIASDSAKQNRKQNLIHQIISNLDTLSLKGKPKLKVQRDSFKVNNTFFAQYLVYRKDLSNFETELNQQFKGDLKLYLQYLKKKYSK